MREIVSAAFSPASELLKANRAVLEKGAALLLEKETLVEVELELLFGELRMPSAPAALARSARSTESVTASKRRARTEPAAHEERALHLPVAMEFVVLAALALMIGLIGDPTQDRRGG